MARNPIDILEPPTGFVIADPATVPHNKAQEMVGFLPARRGRTRLAHLLKRIRRNFGFTINGTAIWQSAGGEGDRLLLFSGTKLYTLPLYNVWQYDERTDGQHSFYQLPAPTLLGNVPGSSATGVFSTQFHNELILAIGGILCRYYVTFDGLGTEVFYQLGVQPPPGAIVIFSQTTGGNLTQLATYGYVYTIVDELGRESSPSAETGVTLLSVNNSITVQQNGGAYLAGGGETSWNIYRRNPGSLTLNLVANVPYGTLTYADNLADNVVAAGAVAPEPGENDVGSLLGRGFLATAQDMCVWKDRLVIGQASTVLVSNAGSATQFSSLPLPTSVADGLRFTLQGPNQNYVTGLESLGSLLACFGRSSTSLLYGDSIADFTQRQVLERGCTNSLGIQRCENEILFPSDDGIYSIGYEDGYTDKKVSAEIEDLFLGFTPTAQAGNPQAIGREVSVQVQNALSQAVMSWYSENRYYISFGNRTLCFDLHSRGWSDTGYGFVKTVTRYYSQMAAISGSAPETIFLTLADQNSYANDLHYYTVADTPLDVDAPQVVASRIVYRPISSAQQIKIRPTFLSVFGDCNARAMEVIGTLKWFSNAKLIATQPIYFRNSWKRLLAMFEAQVPETEGDECWFELDFTRNDIELGNALCEFVRVA